MLGIVLDTPKVTAYVQSAPLTFADLPHHRRGVGPALSAAGQDARPGGRHCRYRSAGGQQIVAGPAGRRVRQIACGSRCCRRAPSPRPAATPAGLGYRARSTGRCSSSTSFPPAIDAGGNTAWSVTTAERVPGMLSIPAAARIHDCCRPAPLTRTASEAADRADGAIGPGGPDQPDPGRAAGRIYDAATVSVNANAVLATNGETVQEILGSGDATNPALQFTLKQAPLTYLTAATSSGAQSTLQVWVNNLQWHETRRTCCTAGPADRVFVTSVNPSGNTVVQFGNGTQGARPPTGTGEHPGRLPQRHRQRGHGQRRAAQPAAGPARRACRRSPTRARRPAPPIRPPPTEIRAIAPLPTLTISRVVALEDYQNYALGFAGIAKALATWTWSGNTPGGVPDHRRRERAGLSGR